MTMQLADAAEAIAIDEGPREYYVYYGREDEDVPMDVMNRFVRQGVQGLGIQSAQAIEDRDSQRGGGGD